MGLAIFTLFTYLAAAADDTLCRATRFHELGRFAQARPLYLAHQRLVDVLYGAATVPGAEARLYMSSIYLAELRLTDAEETARQALHIFETLEPQPAAGTAHALMVLGTVLAEEGQLARATPVLKRSVYLLSKAPNSSFDAVIAEENLAIVYQRQGDLSAARVLLEDVLLMNPADANANAALAEVAMGQERWAEAGQLLQAAQAQLQDSSHPRMAGILRLQAALKAHSRDLTGAIHDLHAALGIAEAAYGPHSQVTLALLQDEVLVLHRLRRRTEARAVNRKLQDLRRTVSRPTLLSP